MAYTMTADNEAWITQDIPNSRYFTIAVEEDPDLLGDYELNLQASLPDCPTSTS